ncbi:hypothetical protein D3C81_2061870 [compost metagenome]
MQQCCRALHYRVPLGLRNATRTVVAEYTGFQRQAEIFVEGDGLGQCPGGQNDADQAKCLHARHRCLRYCCCVVRVLGGDGVARRWAPMPVLASICCG